MAAAAAPQTTTSSDADFIRFPPFPSPPAGVKIIPFKDFKETGIKLFCSNEDGIEVDGAGVPTIALEHKHTTDHCKTDASRKKEEQETTVTKKRKVKANVSANEGPRKWWEIWQDEEAGKFAGPYSLKTPAAERLYRAATDFRTSRTWPKPEARKLGVDKLWDQFSVFIGLQAVIPAWIRAERIKEENAAKAIRDTIEKAGENANPAQDESDGDDDDDVSVEDAPIIPRECLPEDANEENTLQHEDETAAIEEENIRKEDRISAFLADPETVVKMFLSSYMRKEGLIWSDPNLFNAPRVLSFFFRFVLRNKLLPEHETGFKKALVVIEGAQQELPATSVIAKMIPCEVALALRDQFGSKAETFKYHALQYEEDENVDANTATGNIDTNDVLEEATIEYIGDGEYVDVIRPVDTGIARIDEAGQDDEDGDRSRKRVKLDDENSDAQETTMDVDANNNADDAGNANNANDVGNVNDTGWGSAWNHEASWDDISGNSPPVWTLPVYSLSKFLGMDTLPATHVIGIVEESVRRIIRVHSPDEKLNLVGTLEDQLETKLGRIVLGPWNEWDVPTEGEGLDDIRRVYTEIYKGKRLDKGIRRLNLKEGGDGEENQKTQGKPKPEDYYDEDAQDNTESTAAKIIWESSRGWVVEPSSGDIVFSDCIPEKPARNELQDRCKVHDPHKDLIEVIVDPSVNNKLKDNVGMGLGGTFVQLVQDEMVRTGGKGAAKTFWYMEDLKMVIPSFYTS